jgi:hypothetical protein
VKGDRAGKGWGGGSFALASRGWQSPDGAVLVGVGSISLHFGCSVPTTVPTR